MHTRRHEFYLAHNYRDSLARQPLAGKEGLERLRYSSCGSGIQLSIIAVR